MFVSRFEGVFWKVARFISGGFGDWLYRVVLAGLLLRFLRLRLPCLYGMSGFALFVV